MNREAVRFVNHHNLCILEDDSLFECFGQHIRMNPLQLLSELLEFPHTFLHWVFRNL